MFRENGFAYRIIAICIVIFIAISGVIINKIAGKDGVVETAVNIESSYDKEDVLDKINYMLRQHFVELNEQAKESNTTISEIYNDSVVIDYLKQNSIIEEIQKDEELYKINIDKVYENESKKPLLQGTYYVKKQENVYNIVYLNPDNSEEIVGELQIQHM